MLSSVNRNSWRQGEYEQRRQVVQLIVALDGRSGERIPCFFVCRFFISFTLLAIYHSLLTDCLLPLSPFNTITTLTVMPRARRKLLHEPRATLFRAGPALRAPAARSSCGVTNRSTQKMTAYFRTAA